MTRGQPPNRLGWTSESASQISKVSKFSSGSKSSEARYQRKIAETELAAAEEIAELERHAEARDLERKRELIHKRMELQKAAAAEEAAVRLSLPPSSTTSLVGAPLTSDRSSPPPQVRSAVLTTRRLELLAKPRQLQRGRSVSPPRRSGHIELDRYSLHGLPVVREFLPSAEVLSANISTTCSSSSSDDESAHANQSLPRAGSSSSSANSVQLSHRSVSRGQVAKAFAPATASVSTASKVPQAYGHQSGEPLPTPWFSKVTLGQPPAHVPSRMPQQLVPHSTASIQSFQCNPGPSNKSSKPMMMGPTAPAVLAPVAQSGASLTTQWQPPAVAVHVSPDRQVMQSMEQHAKNSQSGPMRSTYTTSKQLCADKPVSNSNIQPWCNQNQAFMPLPSPDHKPSLQSHQPVPRSAPLHHVKLMKLPTFDGQQCNFVVWRQRFGRIVDEDQSVSEDYKFERLREALAGGKAEDIIAGVIDGAGAYQAALDELTAWYGGSDREMERQQRELLALARISNERDVGGLEKLAIKLRNLLINMNSYGIQPGRDLYLSVSEKLPRSLLLRFVETFDDSSSDIHVLSDWLLDRVRKFRHVDQRLASVTEPRPDSRPKKPVTYDRSERHVQRTYAATAAPDGSRQAQTYLCLKCNAPHRLEDCKEFKAMPVGKRWELVKSKPLVCAVCFKSGHWSSECYCKGCSSCQRKHHQLLHIDPG